MFYKVKIKKVPKAKVGYQVQGSLANDVPAMGGADYNSYMGVPNPKVKKVLQPVPREEANLEAEKGETVIGNIDGSMMPSLYTIGGKRHVNGGTPLNLPDDSFIFSDTKSMMISDPLILKMYNKPVKKGGYTPAELSKQFDMNRYRKILQDPNSDSIDRKTAEMMIKNYVMKLGALALALEKQIVTIRLWEKKGYIPGAPYRLRSKSLNGKKVNGNRVYTRELIEITIEEFESRGLLNSPRVEWSLHSDLTDVLVERWRDAVQSK